MHTYIHTYCNQKRECFHIFSSTLSEERRHAALIRRAERAEENTTMQNEQKHKRGKRFLLLVFFFCLPPVCRSVNSTCSWVSASSSSLKQVHFCVIVSVKCLSTGQQKSCIKVEKGIRKAKCLPKVNKKNRKVQVRCNSCLFLRDKNFI